MHSARRWALNLNLAQMLHQYWRTKYKCNHFFGIDNLFLSPHSPSPKVARVQIEVLLDSKSAQASLTIWHIHHTDRPPSAREKQFRKKTNAIDVIKEIHFSINLVESATSIHRHTHPYLHNLKTICISRKSLPGSSIKIFLSTGLPNYQIAWFQYF